MKHPICQTRNDVPVYVDLIHSQAAAHIAQQPYLLELVKEALAHTAVSKTKLNIERDMGRPIGYDFVVQTTDKDTILYARQLREDTFTRFVKNGQPLPTPYLTVILRHGDDDTYELHDTWIGRANPPRPGSENETVESRPYWENHAFILDNRRMQLRTMTKVCPY